VLRDEIRSEKWRLSGERLDQRRAESVQIGDMYATVPKKPPVCVWPKSARWAPPKSPSFALPAAS
jgi:hypothetical protein